MTIILNENTPENLLNSVFINKDNENEKLIPKLLDNCINTKIFKYLSEREANSCSLASNIKLLHDINNSNNQYIKKLIENENDFKVFNEVLVSEIYTKFNGKLLFNELNGFPTQFNTISDVEMSVRSVEQLYNEDLNIYNTYKNGGNYKTLFEEKLKRDEEEKKIDTNLLATSQLASSIVLSNPDENENNKEEEKEEEKKEGIPLLIIDVNIRQGVKKKIYVYEGDTPEGLAQKFANEHNLESETQEKLKNLIHNHMLRLLTRIDEENQSLSKKAQ
jgi:uncharacterized protein YajQ (UPF0234 family)